MGQEVWSVWSEAGSGAGGAQPHSRCAVRRVWDGAGSVECVEWGREMWTRRRRKLRCTRSVSHGHQRPPIHLLPPRPPCNPHPVHVPHLPHLCQDAAQYLAGVDHIQHHGWAALRCGDQPGSLHVRGGRAKKCEQSVDRRARAFTARMMLRPGAKACAWTEVPRAALRCGDQPRSLHSFKRVGNTRKSISKGGL